MNRDETLKLFHQGREAWNAWAERMLAERQRLMDAEKWVEGDDEEKWNAQTRAWHKDARADFRKNSFPNIADLDQFIFPGQALFIHVRFTGPAHFKDTVFEGDAWFNNATFQRLADFHRADFKCNAGFQGVRFESRSAFESATFEDRAEFLHTMFKDVTRFREARFGGVATFSLASFNSHLNFKNAIFKNEARFSGIRGESGFALNEATFHEVPNFGQAHFLEAPRLDNVCIKPKRPASLFHPDPDLPSRWRSLKRLAVQGHDHAREQEFFKNEMVSRRFCEDMPWHAVFWAGLGYQLFSDFGRSIWRPALWLLAFTLLFAGSYYTLQPSSNQGAGRHACIVGPGEPVPAALQLSLRRTLLLPGIGGNGKLDEIYACLYGVDARQPQPPGRLVPPYRARIPDSVAVLGLVQGVLSAVLFFLLLLAVRNHFRIK